MTDLRDPPMTAPQRAQLRTLCEEAQEPFDDTLGQAEAARRIDELHARHREIFGDEDDGSSTVAVEKIVSP